MSQRLLVPPVHTPHLISPKNGHHISLYCCSLDGVGTRWWEVQQRPWTSGWEHLLKLAKPGSLKWWSHRLGCHLDHCVGVLIKPLYLWMSCYSSLSDVIVHSSLNKTQCWFKKQNGFGKSTLKSLTLDRSLGLLNWSAILSYLEE